MCENWMWDQKALDFAHYNTTFLFRAANLSLQYRNLDIGLCSADLKIKEDAF